MLECKKHFANRDITCKECNENFKQNCRSQATDGMLNFLYRNPNKMKTFIDKEEWIRIEYTRDINWNIIIQSVGNLQTEAEWIPLNDLTVYRLDSLLQEVQNRLRSEKDEWCFWTYVKETNLRHSQLLAIETILTTYFMN